MFDPSYFASSKFSLDAMTLTSDQFKTIIFELGAPENLILDTKITRLACLGAEI